VVGVQGHDKLPDGFWLHITTAFVIVTALITKVTSQAESDADLPRTVYIGGWQILQSFECPLLYAKQLAYKHLVPKALEQVRLGFI
jgi:hypothetical protein